MKEISKILFLVTRSENNIFALKEIYLSDLENDLCNLVLEGNIDDTKAATLLYNCSKAHPKFKMLKSRVKKKLYDLIQLSQLEVFGKKNLDRKEKESLESIYKGTILTYSSEMLLGEKLLQKALKIANSYELTALSILATEKLKYIYAQFGNEKSYKEITVELQRLRQLKQIEDEAYDIYFSAKLELNKSITSRKEYLPKLSPQLNFLESSWNNTGSNNIFNNFFKLKIWLNELAGNYYNVIELVKDSEDLIQAGKVNEEIFDVLYLKYISVYAYLRARKISNGLRYALEYKSSFDENSNNYFAFMENYFLLSMHALDFGLAYTLLEEVEKNPAFLKIIHQSKERWNLYRAYLHLVSPQTAKPKNFNYNDLVKAVPVYSKDKQGFNIAILILQFMHYLKSQDIEAIIYRIDSLRKYAGKHIVDNNNRRTQVLFEMLRLVVKGNFVKAEVLSSTSELFSELKVTPPPGDAFGEIEIVPYEHLWAICLENLI